jgi:phosphatidylglycerol:prolipoprotein diacylglycerol transferase
MDYGTPTKLPWGVVYLNPNSYAPIDGVPRHPDQYYELIGDLVIAAILVRLRAKLRPGSLLRLYLVLFSVLRFFVFFLRGNVGPIGVGLKNGQWTARAILIAAVVGTIPPQMRARGRKSSFRSDPGVEGARQ